MIALTSNLAMRQKRRIDFDPKWFDWQAPEVPETGGIAYSPHWRDLKRTAGCTMDDSLIATNFRRFLKERGIARNAANIEKLFSDFCAKVGRV